MRPFLVLLAIWLITGAGAVLGSGLGNAAGKTGLWAGGVVGGALAVPLAVALAVRFKWLDRGERGGAVAGGIFGFAVAAPLAVSNLHTPVVPVLSTALVGIGALVGAGVSRGWQR